MKLLVKTLSEFGRVPTRGSDNSAGLDLYSPKLVGCLPRVIARVPLRIAVAIPDGYFGLIRDRSSIGGKGVVVCGGVIDSDYRGELILCLMNTGEEEQWFKVGDRIAQMVILPVPSIEIVESGDLGATDRGEGGFGSTGV